MGSDYKISPKVPELQEAALLDQANPNQNQWYTLLAATGQCIVWDVGIGVATANETLEVRITADNEIMTSNAHAAIFDTDYWVRLRPSAIAQAPNLEIETWGEIRSGMSPLIMGRSVQIEVRKTTAAGAGDLRAIAIYGIQLP